MTEPRPTCFVIMPISTPAPLVERYGGDTEHFVHVLDLLHGLAAGAAGFKVEGPAADGSQVIHERIVSCLQDADLVLCDLSSLNANVLFELGIRVAVNRPVALVHDEQTDLERVFDVRVAQSHQYQSDLRAWNRDDQVNRLKAHLQATVEQSSGKNALWRTFGVRTEARLEQPENSFEQTTLDLLQGLANDNRAQAGRLDRFEQMQGQGYVSPQWRVRSAEFAPSVDSPFVRAADLDSSAEARYSAFLGRISQSPGVRFALEGEHVIVINDTGQTLDWKYQSDIERAAEILALTVRYEP